MGQTLSEPVVDKVRENCLNQVCCLETPLSLSPHNNHPIAIPNSFPISPAISATNSEPEHDEKPFPLLQTDRLLFSVYHMNCVHLFPIVANSLVTCLDFVGRSR